MHGGQGWLKEAGAQVQVDVCGFGELRSRVGVGSVVGVGSGVGALDSGFLCVGVAALSFSSFTPSKGKLVL